VGIGDKIRRALYEEETGDKGKGADKAPAPAPATPRSAGPTVVGSSTFNIGTPTAQPDPKWMTALQDRIKPVCNERFLAFLDNLDKMGKIIPDEATLFRAALAGVPGGTLGDILHEISDCDTVLSDQLGQFQGAINGKVSTAVDAKRNAVEKANTDIERLRLQIEQLENKKRELEREVEDAQRVAEAESAGFMTAHGVLTQKYRVLREKVMLYLQEGGV